VKVFALLAIKQLAKEVDTKEATELARIRQKLN
jgi:hypothetical protein